MKAKIAYLTSPAPNVFVLNFQIDGAEGIERLEISKAHLSNIIIDGASFALRETSKTAFPTTQNESAINDRAGA